MSPLERVRQFIANRPPAEQLPADLRLRVLEILARDGRHTTLSLALALGRPRDSALYAALAELLESRAIGTDPRRCDFFARERGT